MWKSRVMYTNIHVCMDGDFHTTFYYLTLWSRHRRRGQPFFDCLEVQLHIIGNIFWTVTFRKQSAYTPLVLLFHREMADAQRADGIIEGLDFLVNQAIASFQLWTGLKVPEEVLPSLYQSLYQQTVYTAELPE